MKKKLILSSIVVPALCSCSELVNGIKEFGDARVTADYFLKDYTDFFFYKDKDYVCVAHTSSNVVKGEYVSAINGKKSNSYRFYTFANYDEPNYLVVNYYNKISKVDEDYFYASIDAPAIPFEFLSFPYKTQDPESFVMNSNRYVYYDESVQNIEKGEEVLKKDGASYYLVKDYPNWIMKPTENTIKLYYSMNMATFDVNMAWLAKDITVK